ncbi:poly-beta-1,6-N-acetyl-D-glucosamine biosynthesis protein PgaD [Alkanindiges illinoisensis]|uniref:Poly-beta-1,6-N-acetyl-D-glucosamine biosynthesis protein PgaD n=1 Tax=Alkanindiges illinoisensis TaxID=197183 RepID=A0A4Y7XCL0_9GAMM|nr:poly-beta-1,6-N-acetyl-D-glucosamine biosynthesis protein PgaD [Alkanindiges illinoisensis]TEU27323.1 poly-beta-1,6-N-acetyl-D-glucosamine biosynthesis protein PgaD [Alkanindiges illinoisensis]
MGNENKMGIETILDKNFKHENVVLPAFIDRPDLQSWSQRGVFGMLAAAGLMVWLYLFIPLLSLLAWWFGWHRFDQYIVHDYEHGFSQHLTSLVAVIMILGLMLLAWASYNILRFYNKERRHPMPDVQPSDMAHFYELETHMVEQAQGAQVNLFFYDRQGKIVDMAFPVLEQVAQPDKKN